MDHATPNLPSRDFEATSQFYGKLGFSESWRDRGWMILKRGDAALEFFPFPDLDPLESSFGCCLRLDDLESFYRLQECRGAGNQRRSAQAPAAAERVQRSYDCLPCRSGRVACPNGAESGLVSPAFALPPFSLTSIIGAPALPTLDPGPAFLAVPTFRVLTAVLTACVLIGHRQKSYPVRTTGPN